MKTLKFQTASFRTRIYPVRHWTTGSKLKKSSFKMKLSTKRPLRCSVSPERLRPVRYANWPVLGAQSKPAVELEAAVTKDGAWAAVYRLAYVVNPVGEDLPAGRGMQGLRDHDIVPARGRFAPQRRLAGRATIEDRLAVGRVPQSN
jgi:hypothetical protein